MGVIHVPKNIIKFQVYRPALYKTYYMRLTCTSDTTNIGSWWYNPSINKLQYSYTGLGAATWSAGGAMITARQRLAGAGTQNAGLVIGGLVSANVSCTEEYNGTSWSAGGALITARKSLAGAGTQNVGLAFGGTTASLVSCTEEYNGTSWSAGVPLITARDRLAGAGTQNEGLAMGGVNGPSIVSCTEEYNKPLTSVVVDSIQ
jgi:hypothetical protein